jgi:hypothetical protein
MVFTDPNTPVTRRRRHNASCRRQRRRALSARLTQGSPPTCWPDFGLLRNGGARRAQTAPLGGRECGRENGRAPPDKRFDGDQPETFRLWLLRPISEIRDRRHPRGVPSSRSLSALKHLLAVCLCCEYPTSVGPHRTPDAANAMMALAALGGSPAGTPRGAAVGGRCLFAGDPLLLGFAKRPFAVSKRVSRTSQSRRVLPKGFFA